MKLKTNRLDKLFTIIAVSLVLAATSFQMANAHKYYAAMTRVQYNQTKQNLEFSHRFFAHDMEATLSKTAGQELNFEMPDAISPVLRSYMASHFAVKANGQNIERIWVGYELDGNVLWVYEETQMEIAPTTLSFENSLLMGSFDEQVNTITVTIGEFRQ